MANETAKYKSKVNNCNHRHEQVKMSKLWLKFSSLKNSSSLFKKSYGHYHILKQNCLNALTPMSDHGIISLFIKIKIKQANDDNKYKNIN